MTRRPLMLLCLGLIACGQSQVAGVQSPAPSSMPSTINASPGNAPSTGLDLPVSKVDFACRLPVVTSSQGDAGVTMQGGFINLPAAQIEQDPAGTIHYSDNEFTTAAAPVLRGNGVVPFYDRAESRWVPAPARESLADGSAYAYTTLNPRTGGFTAQVVNVASGDVRTFDLSLPWNPDVADFRAEGAYLLASSALGGPGTGVWLLNPRSGTVKQLRSISQVWAVRDDYAWVARFDPRDKTVWPPSELAPANSLVRIDLATGAETIWFYRAGSYPWLLGLDSSNRPVVLLGFGPSSNEIRLIDHPGSSGALVYSGDTSGFDYLQGDHDRLWFGNARGMYLYRPNAGFQKVFAFDGDRATSNRIEPAGFCL